MRVIPERLADLGQTCLDASQELNRTWSGTQGDLQVPRGAAGNVPAGPALVAEHAAATDAAGTAVARLVAVLEADMDGLYECAFAFSTADEENAQQAESTALLLPGIGVI